MISLEEAATAQSSKVLGPRLYLRMAPLLGILGLCDFSLVGAEFEEVLVGRENMES